MVGAIAPPQSAQPEVPARALSSKVAERTQLGLDFSFSICVDLNSAKRFTGGRQRLMIPGAQILDDIRPLLRQAVLLSWIVDAVEQRGLHLAVGETTDQ